MSRPVSRKHTTPPSAQHPTQPNASGTAQSSIPPFLTQPLELYELGDLSASIIEDTQTRASGRHHITAHRVSGMAASTLASPSHRSEEGTQRAESGRQGHSSHNPGPSITPAAGPKSRSPPALDNSPPPELLDAQRDLLELWTKDRGLLPEIVYKGVIQATKSYFPDLKWGQSEPTRSQGSPTGLNAEIIKQHIDLDDYTSALALDDTHGSTHGATHRSQHGSKSSRDAAGGMPPDREGTSSIPTPPGGRSPLEQVTALPLKKKGKSTTTSKPKNLGNIRATIKSEEDFRDAFLDWHLDAIEAGGLVIDLLELARETVKDVEPKFQQRLRDAEKQERQQMRRPGRTRGPSARGIRTGRAEIAEEIWQVLFTVIANMFVYGLEPLFKTVDASSTIDTGLFGPNSDALNRRNVGVPSDGVTGHLSQDGSFSMVDKEKLGKVRRGLSDWKSEKNKPQKQLDKVYAYYNRLQTVRLFDSLMSSWNDDGEERDRHLQGVIGYHGQKAVTVWLSYICLGGVTTHWLLADDHEEIKELTEMILGFRPICSLVEALGEGVLLLLQVVDDNAEKFVLGKVGKQQEYYPQHEKIRDIALSLCKVDQERYEGRLRQQFARLEERVLRPVLQRREGGNARVLRLDCPQKKIFDMENVGKRIEYILTCVDRRNGGHSDVRNVQGGVRQSQADGSDQGRSKRRRIESIEDEESSTDGSRSGADPGDDLYAP